MTASSGKFRRVARFRRVGFARGARARFFDLRGALVQKLLASGLLLGIHLPARLPEGFLILFNLLPSRSMGRLRCLLRSHGAGIALGYHRQQWLEEKCP